MIDEVLMTFCELKFSFALPGPSQDKEMDVPHERNREFVTVNT